MSTPFTWKLVLSFCAGGVLLTGQSQSHSSSDNAAPISAKERIRWVVFSTAGPQALLGSAFSASFGTLVDRPREYDTHWDGFGRRLEMGVSGNAFSNTMEAGLGAIWGEDPRYFRLGAEAPLKSRVGKILKMTVMAERRDGRNRPAYARMIAIPSTNFISNSWREPSDGTVGQASLRTLFGFLGQLGGNIWAEFWPDVRQKFAGKK